MGKFSLKNLIFIGFFVGIFGVKILRLGNFSSLISLAFWQAWLWQFGLWLAGGLVGWQLPKLDQLLWVWFTYPQDKISLYIKSLVSQKKIKQLISELASYKSSQLHLTSRSFLFQLAWVALAIFTITSTASNFSKGLIMGLGLYLLFDNWQDQAKNPTILNSWLFWQIKRPVSLEEQKWYLGIMTGIFGVLSLLI
jgi:hypothetical protein